MASDTDQTSSAEASAERLRREEREGPQQHRLPPRDPARVGRPPPDLYTLNDQDVLQGIPAATPPYTTCLQSIDELLARDRQRAKDGFPRKIRVGRMIKPGTRGNEKVVVVPTTVEEKLIHDQVRDPQEEEQTSGGSGEGEPGDIIGEQPVRPSGAGSGPGQGEGGEPVGGASLVVGIVGEPVVGDPRLGIENRALDAEGEARAIELRAEANKLRLTLVGEGEGDAAKARLLGIKEAGADILRGGAYKPRTSPYSFQGMGEPGLKIMSDVKRETGLVTITEAIDKESCDLVAKYCDVEATNTHCAHEPPLGGSGLAAAGYSSPGCSPGRLPQA